MDLSLTQLLAETKRLRQRFEATQPNSSRLSILMRDELRLERMLRERAA